MLKKNNNDHPSIQELFLKFPILCDAAVDLIRKLPELQKVFKIQRAWPFIIEIVDIDNIYIG
jgi:hypothetical protein